MDIQWGYLALFRYGHRGSRYSRELSYARRGRYKDVSGCVAYRYTVFLSKRDTHLIGNIIDNRLVHRVL